MAEETTTSTGGSGSSGNTSGSSSGTTSGSTSSGNVPDTNPTIVRKSTGESSEKK